MPVGGAAGCVSGKMDGSSTPGLRSSPWPACPPEDAEGGCRRAAAARIDGQGGETLGHERAAGEAPTSAADAWTPSPASASTSSSGPPGGRQGSPEGSCAAGHDEVDREYLAQGGEGRPREDRASHVSTPSVASQPRGEAACRSRGRVEEESARRSGSTRARGREEGGRRSAVAVVVGLAVGGDLSGGRRRGVGCRGVREKGIEERGVLTRESEGMRIR